MSFEDLLAKFATQSQEQWLQLARKEWRGRNPEDFAIHFADAEEASAKTQSLSPYYATQLQTRDIEHDHVDGESDSSQPVGWNCLSDLSQTAQDQADSTQLLDLILQELEGGAQGFVLEAERLLSLADVDHAIRFDFLQVHLVGDTSAILDGLSSLIPIDQSADVQLYVPVAAGRGEEAVRLLARFPSLRWVLELNGHSAVELVADLRRQLSELLASGQSEKLHLLLPRLAIRYPAPVDYLSGVALPGAMRQICIGLLNVGIASDHSILPTFTASIQPKSFDLPEQYLIDATVRVTAAVSGGVDATIVGPFGKTARDRRQARNLQQVLSLESGLAQAKQAVSGASFFEQAIDVLVKSSVQL